MKGENTEHTGFSTYLPSGFGIILLFLFYPLFVRNVQSQEQAARTKALIEDIMESLVSKSDRQTDQTSLIEQLEFLAENPVPVNTAGYEEFESLLLLNDFQIKSLQQYITENGPILSSYELQFVYGFDRHTAELILPFITFSEQDLKEKKLFRKPLKYGRHSLFLRTGRILETPEGFLRLPDSVTDASPNKTYLGSPWKLYTRYAFNYKERLAFGFTAEKDPGESFFRQSNPKGYDFYSGFIRLKNIWKIKTLVIGDYEPTFGQGLTIWSGLNYGKTNEVLLVEKRRNEIRKYSSTNENQFFRGFATTIDLGMPEISVFVSSKKIDANVLEWDSLSYKPKSVSSLYGPGIHGIPSQIEDKNALDETLYGFNLSLNKNRWHFGASMLNYKYGAPLIISDQLYKQYDFHGTEGSKIGADYRLSLKKGMLYGEVSHNPGYGWAFLQGGMFQLHELWSVSFLYRNYSKDFHPIYSNAFGENSENKNETGFYFGTRVHPFRKLSFSGYIDIFSFPWLKWQVSAPSNGWEYYLQADLTLSNELNMQFRFQDERKEENIQGESQMIKTGDRTRKKARYQLSYEVSPSLILRNRIEWAGFNKGVIKEQGYLIYQDIIYHLLHFPLDLTFRFALFDTDSWNTRIYAYENDVLYAFSIPPYYGKGIRSYLMVHSAVSNHIDLWLRLARTTLTEANIIGSGLNAIAGGQKTDVKVQLRVKF